MTAEEIKWQVKYQALRQSMLSFADNIEDITRGHVMERETRESLERVTAIARKVAR